MDIFNILTLFGGISLFLFGMNEMGAGLKKAFGNNLERILEKLTSNKIKAVLLGTGVTALIQSSAATTVMVIGFVNSGIMKMGQAVGVIMGADIGTTVTAWLLSLVGIQGDAVWIQLFKPTSFTPILAVVGVFLVVFSKKEKHHDVGRILMGFAVLMFGMSTMSSAMAPLSEIPEFTSFLTNFNNPILGVITGTFATALIQSSSASIGILQALSVDGYLDYRMAIPIILGMNIGTCVTAMISAAGASKAGKRTALLHLYIKIIGVTLFIVVFYGINAFLPWSFLSMRATAVGIATFHTAFNIIIVLILLPFTKWIIKLTYLTIPDKNHEEQALFELTKELQLLDLRFLETPSIATKQCKNVAMKMADISRAALFQSMLLFDDYDEEKAKEVWDMEEIVDRYEDELGDYLLKLSAKNVTERDSQTISTLLQCMGDFERISDHAVNLMQAAKEMNKKELQFSKKAQEEVQIFSDLVREIVNTTLTVFDTEDSLLAKEVEPMEDVADEMNEEIKKRHIKRLRKGKCTIELGLTLSDITTNYERVADHCSNVAICMIQKPESDYGSHIYVSNLNKEEGSAYHESFVKYAEQFMLPKKETEEAIQPAEESKKKAKGKKAETKDSKEKADKKAEEKAAAKSDKLDKAEKQAESKLYKPDKFEQAEKAEKAEKTDKKYKAEKSEKFDKTEKSEKTDKSDKSEKKTETKKKK